MTPRLEIYQDRKREWRWRIRAGNRLIVGDSGEGYASKANAMRGFRAALKAMMTATF